MRSAIRTVRPGFLVAVAIVLVVAHVLAQLKIEPDDPRSSKFTALPDIKMPRKEVQLKGRKANFPDFEKPLERLAARHPRPIPDDAPPLVKVRTAQVNEGTLYLSGIVSRFAALNERELRMEENEETIRAATDIFRVAAELETTAAGKLGYYEDRVALFKLIEEATAVRVRRGNYPPHVLNVVAFYRLQAEADLLQLKQSLKR